MPRGKRDVLYEAYLAYLILKGYEKLDAETMMRELQLTRRAILNFVKWLLKEGYALEITDKNDRRKRYFILKRKLQGVPLNATTVVV